MEARWLMEGLEPDHRMISDFRKDNIGSMKKVFHEFNSRLFEVLVSGFVSVDGSKFQACFRPDRQKMDQRKCLSEYPFGTVKRWMNAGYYLLKGIQKTDGETALIFLGYNLARAINLLGFQEMMKIMA